MSTTELPSDIRVIQERLLDRLTAFSRRVRRLLLLEGTTWLVSLIVGAVLLTLAFDWWLEFQVATRIAITMAFAGGLLTFVRLRVLRLWTSPLDPLELMSSLDESRQDKNVQIENRAEWQRIAPRVATVLQLPGQMSEQSAVSESLIHRAVEQSHAVLDPIDFSVFLNRRHQRQCLAILFGALMLPVLLTAISPLTVKIWADRWLLAGDTPWPRSTSLELVGYVNGRLMVPRGESVLLQLNVTDRDEATEHVRMHIDQTENSLDEDVTFTQYAPGDFRYELTPLMAPITVTIRGGDARLGPVLIEPVDRPRLTEMKLTGKYPQRETPVEYRFSGTEGTVQLLPSAEAELEMIAGEPLAKIELEMISGQVGPAASDDQRKFIARWTHREAVQMRVTLVSAVTGLSSFPRPVAIGLQPDRPPHLTFKQTGVKLRVTPNSVIPWVLSARDDFGIQSVNLDQKLTRLLVNSASTEATSPPEAKSPAGEKSGTDAPATSESLTEQSTRSLYGPVMPTKETGLELNGQVELAPFKLTPGCTVELAVEAKDDCITGAQTTRSRSLVFRIVTPEELFREILLRQQQLRARLRKTADEAEKIRDEIPLGQYPEQAGEFLRRHRVVQREVSMIQQSLGETVAEMEWNKLGGPEAHQLIRQSVLDPLSDLHDRTLTQQRDAWEKLADDSTSAIESLAKRQDQIVADMDRILKNMAQWDSFIDVINQLNAVIQLETEIRKHTETMREKQIESVFDEEEDKKK
ncbi:MAG: hypothetical protein ACKVT0_16445 [Planctomycetaceae bacterium]